MVKLMISTALKNKDATKGADVAKGVMVSSKWRTQVLEEEGKLLLVWLNEKYLAGDSINEALIHEKAGNCTVIYCKKKKNTPKQQQ